MTTDAARDAFEIDWTLADAAPTAAVETTTEAASTVGAEIGMPIANELAGGRAPREYRTAEQRAQIRAANEAAEATPSARARKANEERAAREEAEAKKKAQAALDGAILVAISGSATGSYPHGAIVNWRPVGSIAWGVVDAAATEGGVQGPARRSIASMASAAVGALKAAGYKVETVTRGSAWRVYRSAGQKVALGSSVGDAVVNATLGGFGGEELELEGPAELAGIVRAAFDLARADQTLTSAEVTSWLGDILDGWRAVPTCYGRWIAPGEITDRWLRLAAALAKAGLPVPARPAGVIAREDIRDEIELGLRGEVTNLVTKIVGARDRARSESKKGDITARGAASLLNEIADARAKIELYEVLVGPMTAARAELATISGELNAIADDTAQRGANLELE